MADREASILEPSWGPGRLWEPDPEMETELQLQLGLGLSLVLGLWPAEPETRNDAGTSMFPSLGRVM